MDDPGHNVFMITGEARVIDLLDPGSRSWIRHQDPRRKE